MGRYGNSIYKKHVERKIRQIKTKIAPEYWPQAFRDSGGTSLWAPIPIIILQLLTLFGMFYGTYQGILQKNVKANTVANTADTGTVPQNERSPTVQTPAERKAAWVEQQRRLAENGDAAAQCNLGGYYQFRGQVLPQDYTVAMKWLRRAANQGNAEAQAMLGSRYSLGEGAPQDEVEAYKWYGLASDQGDKNAAALRDDIAAKMTPDQIAEGQRLAREFQPHKESAAEAAAMAPQDAALEASEETDIKLFEDTKAKAESGDAAAELNLFNCYLDGIGVQSDFVGGVGWLRKAADQGNADAQVLLGLYYQQGTGMTQDYVQAWKWFKLAENQGNNGAFLWRVTLAAKMTPDQIAEAQKLSTEFQPHIESAATNSN